MLLKGIFRTNIQKHGFFRATFGGVLMYPSVIIFVVFETIFFKYLTRVLLIFNNDFPVINKKEFISYGRIDLDNYNWFDRLNCHFCAYANGVTQIVSITLDLIGNCKIDNLIESKKHHVQRIMSKIIKIAMPLGIISYFIFVSALSRLLHYDRPDKNVIKESLKKINYGKGLRSDSFTSVFPNAFKLRFMFKSIEHTLSIIESQWCPLTYANKEILLKHQENFISSGFDDVVVFMLKGIKQ